MNSRRLYEGYLRYSRNPTNLIHYMKTEKYRNRLFNEWKQHSKIIIAVDYDDTLFPWGFKSDEDHMDLLKTIELLRKAHETGAYITIFTCSDKSRQPEILEYCKKINLPVDSINTNPIDLPYGKEGKVYANIFIDDRAGLNESLSILEDAMWKIRGLKAKHLTDGEEVL